MIDSVVLYAIRDGSVMKRGSGHTSLLLNLTGLGLNIGGLRKFGDIWGALSSQRKGYPGRPSQRDNECLSMTS